MAVILELFQPLDADQSLHVFELRIIGDHSCPDCLSQGGCEGIGLRETMVGLDVGSSEVEESHHCKGVKDV